MKIKFGELALLFAFGILLCAAWSNIAVYAQNKTASTSSTNPAQQHIAKIKITSPTRGQQVPVGKDLTVSGTSIDNATASSTDCKVYVIVNKVRPYQPTTAAGTGGAADYSKWNFVLTSKYTTIKPGENRITSKYQCANDPSTNLFSSVNVTGVPSSTSNSITTTGTAAATTKAADATTTVTKPSAITTPQAQTTKASTAAKEQQQQHPVTANNNNPASSISNNAEVQRVAPVSSVNNKPLSSTPTSTIAPQVKAINQQPQMVTVSNNTNGQNSRLASPSPVIASDKMMYLGYPPSATNNKYLTEKNVVGPKSTTRVSNTDTITDNSSTNKGSIDIKYRTHDIPNNNHNDVSTSQVNIKRNTGNANNNFIFPFSYP